jgi:AraC family transcriptional regulator
MPSQNTQTVKGALSSAGAELVRTARTASGITISEWRGQNTLIEYQGSTEDVLSISLNGGQRCSHVKDSKVVGRGFEGAICLFPAGGGRSQWAISEQLHLLHIYFGRLGIQNSVVHSPVRPLQEYRFREVFQERCPVISSAAHSIAHSDWTDSSLSLGIDGLLSWILLNAIRAYAAAGLEAEDTRGRFSKLESKLIVEYLKANLGNKIRLEDLARLCNLSRYHFLRKFKNTFGSSPHAYLTSLRMGHAHELLTDGGAKITAVALECGYNQHSQFATVFKRHFGYSPSEVRSRG